MSPVYIYDPTAADALSKVRGIGRYLQILRENFGDEFTFTSDLQDVPQHATFVNPFFNFLQPPLHLKKVCRRQIAVVHDLIPLKFPAHYPIGVKGNIYKNLNKAALKRYDTIITDSEHSKKDIIKILHIKPEKIKVVYPILSQTFFSHTSKTPLFKLPANYCIYVGDATWNKNVVNIGRAIKKAHAYCVFVGKVFESEISELNHPWQTEIKTFLQDNHDDPHFTFPGYITDNELTYLYENAYANLLVSRDEGFGYSYFEAGALEVPSILADIPVFHETAAETALFADPENSDNIAKKIQELMGNKDLRKKLAKDSQERTKLFTAELFKRNFKEAVEHNGYYEI